MEVKRALSPYSLLPVTIVSHPAVPVYGRLRLADVPLEFLVKKAIAEHDEQKRGWLR